MIKESSKNVSPLVELSASLENEYMDVISKGEDANIANLEFIKSLDAQMRTGLTQEVAIATLKKTAKGIKVGIVVKHGHIPAIKTAGMIIAKYENELPEVTASSILTLAGRVLADVKASGVKAHLAKYDTLKELSDGTKTKAESQADAKGEEKLDTIAAIAAIDASTIEAVIDGILEFFKGKNLSDLSTVELEKAKKVTAIFHAIVKNSQA